MSEEKFRRSLAEVLPMWRNTPNQSINGIKA
mgnify:CR=1 FL=1